MLHASRSDCFFFITLLVVSIIIPVHCSRIAECRAHAVMISAYPNKKRPAGAANKPNSVSNHRLPRGWTTIIHLWAPVARNLLQPTRKLGRAALNRFPIWSCTGWGLPSFPGHPGNWCALTAPFHPYPTPVARRRAVCFLLHFPSRCRDSMLWSTLPFGVRTFL